VSTPAAGDKGALVAALNNHRPAIIRTLGGVIVDVDEGLCVMEYDIGEELCHSTNIVQGGIITAMLDATMSHAVLANNRDVTGLASLEIKVSFLEPSLAGRFTCRGSIRRAGYKISFLEGELYNADGVLTATSSHTAKLTRR
jgi:uncharacterized protein (TIGR00369 family)